MSDDTKAAALAMFRRPPPLWLRSSTFEQAAAFRYWVKELSRFLEGEVSMAKGAEAFRNLEHLHQYAPALASPPATSAGPLFSAGQGT